MKVVAAAMVALTVLGASAHADAILATDTYSGHTYYLLAGDSGGAGVSWASAEATAVSLGGHLVTIDDASENAFVYGAFGSAQVGSHAQVLALHIGFTDQVAEGTWAWIDGSTSTYTNWALNEPNNLGDEDYGAMWGSGLPSIRPGGTWIDFFGAASVVDPATGVTLPLYAVVEVHGTGNPIPEPTTLALLGLGAAGLAVRRRRQRAT